MATHKEITEDVITESVQKTISSKKSHETIDDSKGLEEDRRSVDTSVSSVNDYDSNQIEKDFQEPADVNNSTPEKQDTQAAFDEANDFTADQFGDDYGI